MKDNVINRKYVIINIIRVKYLIYDIYLGILRKLLVLNEEKGPNEIKGKDYFNAFMKHISHNNPRYFLRFLTFFAWNAFYYY